MLPGMSAVMIGSAASLADSVITYLHDAKDNSTESTYSFVSSLGTASSNRLIIVGVGVRDTGSNSITSVTINGDAMTEAVQVGTDTCIAGVYAMSLNSGTTGTIAVNLTSTANRCGIIVWHATNISSAVATDTASEQDASSEVITLQAGGVAVACNYCIGFGADSSTWTGVSEDADMELSGPNNFSGGSVASAAGGNVTATRTGPGSNERFAVAAFR